MFPKTARRVQAPRVRPHYVLEDSALIKVLGRFWDESPFGNTRLLLLTICAAIANLLRLRGDGRMREVREHGGLDFQLSLAWRGK